MWIPSTNTVLDMRPDHRLNTQLMFLNLTVLLIMPNTLVALLQAYITYTVFLCLTVQIFFYNAAIKSTGGFTSWVLTPLKPSSICLTSTKTLSLCNLR